MTPPSRHQEHRRLRLSARLVLLLSLCLIPPVALAGQPSGWVPGSGVVELTSEMTPAQARDLAFRRALAEAQRSVSVEIRSTQSSRRIETPDTLSDFFLQEISSTSHALIVEIDSLLDRLVINERDRLEHRVELRAEFADLLGEPDPGFALDLQINRETYRMGEGLQIRLTATRDCYATIFCRFASDSIQVVAPNETMPVIHLQQPGREFVIPPPGASWVMPVELAGSDTLAFETIFVVATRQDIPFPPFGGSEHKLMISLGQGMLRLNRWLAQIPLNQRAVAEQDYRIIR